MLSNYVLFTLACFTNYKVIAYKTVGGIKSYYLPLVPDLLFWAQAGAFYYREGYVNFASWSQGLLENVAKVANVLKTFLVLEVEKYLVLGVDRLWF